MFFWLSNSATDFIQMFPGVYLRIFVGMVILCDFVGVLFFICFSFSMAASHIDMLIYNTTTIGSGTKAVVKSTGEAYFGYVRNKFDFGYLFNLRAVGLLGPMFWLPVANNNKYEGYYFPELQKSREYLEIKFAKNVTCIKDG